MYHDMRKSKEGQVLLPLLVMNPIHELHLKALKVLPPTYHVGIRLQCETYMGTHKTFSL